MGARVRELDGRFGRARVESWGWLDAINYDSETDNEWRVEDVEKNSRGWGGDLWAWNHFLFSFDQRDVFEGDGFATGWGDAKREADGARNLAQPVE